MRLLLVLIPLLASTLQAASVSISTSCGSQGQLSYSAVGNTCQSTGYTNGPSTVTDGGQYGNASATFAAFSDPYRIRGVADIVTTATVKGTGIGSVLFTTTVYVPGSGTGYIRGVFDVGVSRYGGYASGFYSIAGVASHCSSGGYAYYFYSLSSCPADNSGGYLSLYEPAAIPILLGQSYTVTVGAYANAFSDDNTPAFAMVHNSVEVGFYGADLVTPIAITETPEPSTFALALLPVLFVSCRRMARRALKNLPN